jgi:hypothetical protein
LMVLLLLLHPCLAAGSRHVLLSFPPSVCCGCLGRAQCCRCPIDPGCGVQTAAAVAAAAAVAGAAAAENVVSDCLGRARCCMCPVHPVLVWQQQ